MIRAALAALLILITPAALAGDGQVHVALGAMTCSQSTCHSASTPWPNSSVSQREYVVWRERDPHSGSYATLQTPRAKGIARAIGAGDPTQATRCLGCHAFNHPADKREDTFDITEGVTCEACHGPASNWLGVHAAGLYFYGENIANGMYPTTDATARAELCLDCHVGEGEKFVSHEMMAAGHPTLPFELGFYSWFTTTNPADRSGYAHFTVDDDYLQRKPWPFGVKTWAIGQVIQTRKVLDLVVDPRNAPKGLFPELAHFECRSCHELRSVGDGVAVALPRLKSANLLFAEFATELVDPALARRIRSENAALQAAGKESWDAVIAASRKLRATLKAAEAKLTAHKYRVSDNTRMLQRIAGAYRSGALAEYEAAEQAVLAAGSLVDELARLDALQPVDAAVAINAMASGVSAFENQNDYSRSTVRASLDAIAKIAAKAGD
ncbi:MAG: multiheme c-type cytochrome [Pseudomonadota bacterium]